MEKTNEKDTMVEIVPSEKTNNQSMPVDVAPVKEFDTQSLIAQAIQSNVPVETMERLLVMAEKMQAIKAKQEFNQAMAKFQSECPTIVKTKPVRTKSGQEAYRYAPIESIVEQVKLPLQNNGFSYSTSMELLPTGVKVEVKVTHKDGHCEITPMEVPLGEKTQIMSNSQVVAAASTFAKRYAFCNAFGILTGDEDTDATPDTVGDNKPYLKQGTATLKQKQFIAQLMTDKGYTLDDLMTDGINQNTPATEVIEYLLAAKSKVGPNGQVNFEPPVIQHDNPADYEDPAMGVEY